MTSRQQHRASLLRTCVLLCLALQPLAPAGAGGDGQPPAAALSLDGERREMGERSLKELQRKEEDSPCWRAAVARLNSTCKLLSDVEQSKLAVEFANCHLAKSGRTTYPCTGEMSIKECTLDMDAVAFQTYTEFFTHTSHICYFLQSELWQERTEDTVAKLSLSSDEAVSKLEEALEYHKLMDVKQTEALSNQEEILEQDRKIARSLHETKQNMDQAFTDMNDMAQKQKVLLTEMFGSIQNSIDTIRYLMSLLLVEFVGYETFAVLIVSWVVVMFLPQFAYSRFKLHLTIFVELCFEIVVRRLFGFLYFAGDGKPPPESLAVLHEWLWYCRYAGLVAGVGVYLWEWLSHCDRTSRNTRMLEEIQKQNQRIMAALSDEDKAARKRTGKGAKRASAGLAPSSPRPREESPHPVRHSWPLSTQPQVEEVDFGGDGVRVGMLGRLVMGGEEVDGGVIGSLRRRTTPNRQSLLYFEPIPGLQPPVGHQDSPYTNQRIRDYIDSLQQLPRGSPPPAPSPPHPLEEPSTALPPEDEGSSYAPSESSMLRSPITAVRSGRKRGRDKNSQPLSRTPATSTPRRSTRPHPSAVGHTHNFSNLSVGSSVQLEDVEKETSEEKDKKAAGKKLLASAAGGSRRKAGHRTPVTRCKEEDPLPASPITPHRYNLRARSHTPATSPLQ